MRRILSWLILLGLIIFGLFWPLVLSGTSTSVPASDPVVISDYQADFTVAADGTLTAVETITGEFPSGRHGIFRYWDVANKNSPRVRQTPELSSILLDGEPAPYQLLWEDADRFRVAKIGDESGEETVGDLIRDQRVDLIVNTPVGRGARRDGYEIRRAAISARIPCITTIAGASAAVYAIGRATPVEPRALQDLHADLMAE